ncbi:type II toxin-antitoxin system prevent-host-death family antitoxin [Clostridium sp. D33t1_170424_F3]|uniref:type II toxin-antitoxin system prevent-host-death family antitoxin n=1 Tax=Clostridium sp. D33t1_170424_F3 TaxID=2787099 RepID=UPI001A9AFB8B|nr:type II toxin-antitoxin system prevent-host-death family antitoxin [Clostridium sp. D33t1_170424_F3]
MINTNALVPMTDANQNFSKVVRLVDEQGAVIILKNNKPKYAVVEFSEYDRFQQYRKETIEKMADELIEENLEAFQELAK